MCLCEFFCFVDGSAGGPRYADSASRVLLVHGVCLFNVAMESVTSRGMHTVHPEWGTSLLPFLPSPPSPSPPLPLMQSKVGEFLQLAGNTLVSFLEAYRDSAPPNEVHPEAQFVLALCGTITSEVPMFLLAALISSFPFPPSLLPSPLLSLDIAASTYGREFLCSCEDGRRLIDTLCSVLGTTPPLRH